MKFELNEIERKWIKMLEKDIENNNFFYKFLDGDQYNYFNTET